MMEGETARAARHARARAPCCSARTRACAATTCCRRQARRAHARRSRSPRRSALARDPAGHHARRGALAGRAAARGDSTAQQALFPAGAARPGPAAGRPARPQHVAPARWPRCRRVELLEVQLVNAVAPFILNARLKPLMLRTPERDKHIVNVSAMEGQFYRTLQDDKHPHTNMAKAALNMMTRTSAADYHAGRHPHERRRHRLGDRRGSGGASRRARRRSIASIRRSTSSTARRASSIRSSPASTPASTCGASS